VFIVVFLFSIAIEKNYAQLLWRFKTEAGLYNYKDFKGDSFFDFAGNLEGQIKYTYTDENNSASIKINLRPELLGLENSDSKIKYKAAGKYSVYDKYADYNFNISYQLNNYDIYPVSISQNVILFNADIFWYLFENYHIETNVGYAYQDVDNISAQELDLIFLDLKFYKPFNSNLKISFGAYLEKFSIKNEMKNSAENNSINNGFRFGPQFTLSYLKDWIVSFNYKFILHESDYTKRPSYDHLTRLVAGRLLGKRSSVFLLVDYFSRKYTMEKNTGLNNLYTPFELENHILLKTAYKVYNKNEVYIKAGYTSNNFYFENISLNGWNVMLGFEFRN
jgi:hypothetical protein